MALEVRSLGRTLLRWKHQIAAWHESHVTNAPTEAANNLIKRVKRAAFGFRSFRHYRIRALLYAGKPNWDLLATVTSPCNPKSHFFWGASYCGFAQRHSASTCRIMELYR